MFKKPVTRIEIVLPSICAHYIVTLFFTRRCGLKETYKIVTFILASLLAGELVKEVFYLK